MKNGKLIEAAETMEPLFIKEEGNWYHRFTFRNGKAVVYYIAKDPSQCESGWFGDVAHIRKLLNWKIIGGQTILQEENLTEKGRLLVQSGGVEEKYRKLLEEKGIK